MGRLALLVGVPFLAAWFLRRMVSPAMLKARREQIDRIAVVSLVLFALAQLPMYVLPALQKPLYRRIAALSPPM